MSSVLNPGLADIFTFRSCGELNCVAPSWCSTRHHHRHPVFPPFHSQGSNSESRICNCCIRTFICYGTGAPTSSGITTRTYTSRSAFNRVKGNGRFRSIVRT
jgi:hypothetical protein